MYRLSHVVDIYLDMDRPGIVLRNRNKIKFHSEVTTLFRVMNSPYYRCIKLWDRLAEEVQKATTKVKFKMLIGNTYYYIPVNGNTALLSSHRGCSKDKIRPTLVLRPSTKLSLLLFRQF